MSRGLWVYHSVSRFQWRILFNRTVTYLNNLLLSFLAVSIFVAILMTCIWALGGRFKSSAIVACAVSITVLVLSETSRYCRLETVPDTPPSYLSAVMCCLLGLGSGGDLLLRDPEGLRGRVAGAGEHLVQPAGHARQGSKGRQQGRRRAGAGAGRGQEPRPAFCCCVSGEQGAVD